MGLIAISQAARETKGCVQTYHCHCIDRISELAQSLRGHHGDCLFATHPPDFPTNMTATMLDVMYYLLLLTNVLLPPHNGVKSFLACHTLVQTPPRRRDCC